MAAPRTAAARPDPAELYEALQLGTLAEVADHFDCNRRTVTRWTHRAEYRAYLADLRRLAFDRVAGEAAEDIALAMRTAREIATDGEEAHARLGGARLLLEQHTRLAAADDPPPADDHDEGEQASSLASKVRGLLSRARGEK